MTPHPTPRKGFTLVEVIFALAILAGAVLSMSTFISRFSRTTGETMIASEASDLATERIEAIKADASGANYAALETTFAATESSIPGYPDFTRRTYVTHTVSSTTDYKTVTVVVSHPALQNPVRLTTIISGL